MYIIRCIWFESLSHVDKVFGFGKQSSFIASMQEKTQDFWLYRRREKVPWTPKTMKSQGFGHLKTQVIYHKKPSKNVGFGGPMVGFAEPVLDPM